VNCPFYDFVEIKGLNHLTLKDLHLGKAFETLLQQFFLKSGMKEGIHCYKENYSTPI
jgi:transcriptional antiterminator Rof (Rho-off)